MVSVNLTIIVQVVLFLAFLWAMNRFVFRPLLGLMDARDAQLEADKLQAQADLHAAEQLQRLYHARIAEMHQAASQRFVAAHRKAQQEHNECVQELRQREDALIEEVRTHAARQLAEERQHFDGLAAALAAEIVSRLQLEAPVR